MSYSKKERRRKTNLDKIMAAIQLHVTDMPVAAKMGAVKKRSNKKRGFGAEERR